MFHGKVKLKLMVGELDQTNADVLVRFTDEKGINRDSGNEKAIQRIAGADFDANLKQGMAGLGGDLGGLGKAFMTPTMSTIPGQTVCTTYGPVYKLDPTLDAARLAKAYDTCFSLGTMVSVLSIAFPSYGGGGDEFPIEIAAPIVVDRILAGLDHAASLKQITITVTQDAFLSYSQVVSTRLNLHLKTP
jgi:O-acetyl-ADP-ribose deacetylase (regulator of RNase III)